MKEISPFTELPEPPAWPEEELGVGPVHLEIDLPPPTLDAEAGTPEAVDDETMVVPESAEPLLLPVSGEQGPPGIDGAGFYVENRTITAQMIADAGLTLEHLPDDPLKIEFVIYNGPEQRAGVDFIVTGQFLSWESLALELLLEEGDVITLRYVRST